MGSVPTVAWQAAVDLLADPLAKCFQKAAEEEYPEDWCSNSLFWLKKPGKTGRTPGTFRDICLMGPVAKAYSRTLLWQVQDTLVAGLLPTQFGFIPKRSTADALLMAREILTRTRKGGITLLMASFDLTQAFYRLDRTLLEEVLVSRLSDQSIVLRVMRKLDRVVYRLHQGTEVLELEAPMGVIVGDVLGPLLFVVYMDAFVRQLQEARDRLRWPPTLSFEASNWATATGPSEDGGIMQSFRLQRTSVKASDVIYAGDHDVFRPITGWLQARKEIELVRSYQKAWKMDVNPAKSSVMFSWAGKGSSKMRKKALRTMRLTDGEEIPVVRQQTHLGAIRTGAASLKPAVDLRCKKARNTRTTFQRKLLGNRTVRLDTRLKFYRSLVSPVLLYGLELFRLGPTLLKQLESCQMGFIRAASVSWRHSGGRTNEEARELCQVPTVESQLRKARLSYWRAKLLSPGGDVMRTVVRGRCVSLDQRLTNQTFGVLILEDAVALATALGTPFLETPGPTEVDQFLLQTVPSDFAKILSWKASSTDPLGGKNDALSGALREFQTAFSPSGVEAQSHGPQALACHDPRVPRLQAVLFYLEIRKGPFEL